VTSASSSSNSVPGWVGKLLVALVVYVGATALWMATGWGGPQTQHYLGLIADGPANLVAVIIAAAAARYLPRGPLQAAWRCMAFALTLFPWNSNAIAARIEHWRNGPRAFAITAGFAMMALEELGCLVAPPSIVPKLKRRAGVQ